MGKLLILKKLNFCLKMRYLNKFFVKDNLLRIDLK